MFVAEKGLEIPLVPVDLFRMEQLSEEFLAINPGGTVPVLETDDGTYISEAVAICRYLEALHPEPRLFGDSPRTEALTLMWNNIVENEGIPAIAEVLRNLSPGFRNRVFPGPVDYAQMPELVDRGRQRSEQLFDRVEQRLTDNAYLAGDVFTFADITLLATTDFAGWVDIVPSDGRPALGDWYRRVSARPSAAA